MNRLPVILAALLVLLAGCSSAVPVQNASAGDGEPQNTITVGAAGQVTAAPDLAIVNVAVEHTADTAEAAREGAATDANRMRAALRDAGIPDDAVTTSGFSLHVQYDYSRETREVIGYQAVHSYRIEVTPDRAGEVIDLAVGNGATSVYGVQFGLSEERQQELRAEALSTAMENARSDADTIADAAGVGIVGVSAVSTSNAPVYTPSPVFAEARAADAAGAPTQIEAGDVTVRATVQVTYETN
ncbi:SIMPL domain-containing protein [Natronomonas sp. EA1]|uniref:SIMPL domain-containing protein n=1 Tax=Natronomonas sp. EA1 TaxID=3421655 RepID=UPI003EBD7837